jgi:tRNA pseudouridine55 synthase
LDGFLNIDKPRGLTSHDVVGRVRWLLKQRGLKRIKVGHAGTLDPLATGVLVVCVGGASRLSEYVMGHDKTYRAVVQFGVETDTYDAEGETLSVRDASHLTPDVVRAALPAFIGQIAQIPPMHSAIKQGGKKLYELARAGQTVERPPRAVTIHHITLDGWDARTHAHPEAVLEITCGAGTYIRSLAHDLGAVLGVGAHLTALTRTRSGAFMLSDSLSLEGLAAHEDWSGLLVDLRAGLGSDWPVVVLQGDGLEDVLHGRAVPIVAEASPREGVLALGLTPDAALRAVLRAGGDGRWYPHKVFLPADD